MSPSECLRRASARGQTLRRMGAAVTVRRPVAPYFLAGLLGLVVVAAFAVFGFCGTLICAASCAMPPWGFFPALDSLSAISPSRLRLRRLGWGLGRLRLGRGSRHL